MSAACLLYAALLALAQLPGAGGVHAVGAAVARDAALERYMASGLWVCDPTIRRLLTNAPTTVTGATSWVSAGGPVTNAAAMGGGPYANSGMTSVGYGPLGKHVLVSGAGGRPRTSFRGPISPPSSRTVELDKTARGKRVGKSFSWEETSAADSTGMDQAADAVRVFDVAGLAGGTRPLQGAATLPKAAVSRAAAIVEGATSEDISMNMTALSPVQTELLPAEGPAQAGNEVVKAPYAFEPHTANWVPATSTPGTNSLIETASQDSSVQASADAMQRQLLARAAPWHPVF
eukprot:CAMPEP_0117621994 /NCGR_PEP_ID=MMETSP0784-20121206/87916_1 /TAXON_ID=39447 /ORGANISM="" /LENGTH=289 /DNA_ID=CAMNT_0005425927 /DNA_START=63 /DNA_END=933 /DNA_ORIENTATION=-